MKEKIEALTYALSVVASKRAGKRPTAYLAALDDINVSLSAAIERLEHGDRMETVAVVQDAGGASAARQG